MGNDDTTVQHDPLPPPVGAVDTQLALALAFSAHEPARMGEVLFVEGDERVVVGRTGSTFLQHRPRLRTETGSLNDPSISREQLVVEPASSLRAHFTRVGRQQVRLNGLPVDEGELRPGDVLELGDRAVLVAHARPRDLGSLRATHPFGAPDAQGFVGEGPGAWAVREKIAFVAQRNVHVLVQGPSGTGKELAARALHVLSDRRRGPWVSRSAATIPASLADAELFGNLGNYPNPGMAARPGLIGEADRGTLFLDEFGELPIEIQARLLRVLDDGEYTRLGEAKARRADLRLVAATNRPMDALKHDVLARLPLHLVMPGLETRREDLGLLAFHLLRQIAQDDPDVARDWMSEGPNGEAVPRLTCRLVATLVSHPYHTHVRELSMLLWRAIGASRDGVVDLFPSYGELLAEPVDAAVPGRPVGPVDPHKLDPAVVQACLDRHGGRQELAWRELGLASRHVLARLVKKHDLRVRGR